MMMSSASMTLLLHASHRGDSGTKNQAGTATEATTADHTCIHT